MKDDIREDGERLILHFESLGDNWFEGIIEHFGRELIYSQGMPEFDNCKEYFNIIINLANYLPFPDSYLLCFRVREMPKQIQILHFMTMATMYHQSIRELRYMFEAIIQAYYIDKEHPITSIDCKLEILKEIDRMVGSRLIDSTDLKRKNELKTLYGELSGYIHSSHLKVAPVFENNEHYQNTFFGYNERMFKKSTYLTKKTIDAIIYIILSFDKDLITEINTNQYLYETLSNFELTKHILKEV